MGYFMKVWFRSFLAATKLMAGQFMFQWFSLSLLKRKVERHKDYLVPTRYHIHPTTVPPFLA
jgi:hypothetical protein